MTWAGCVAYPSVEAMRRPETGISMKFRLPRLFYCVTCYFPYYVIMPNPGVYRRIKLMIYEEIYCFNHAVALQYRCLGAVGSHDCGQSDARLAVEQDSLHRPGVAEEP